MSKLDEILKKMSQMETRIAALEKGAVQNDQGKPRACFRCGSPEHFIRDCPYPRAGNEGGPSSARREQV